MRVLAAVFLVLFGGALHAHGGVSMEDDRCIMRIGTMRAHFTGYQPEQRATQEFCEDIPELGKTIIVVDFIDKALRTHDVEFRLLRDTKNLGKRARYEDLGDAGAITAATLVRMDAQRYPKGTLSFEKRFESAGWFIGVLSATDPGTGQTTHSVFPFQVGVTRPWRYVPAFLLVVGLSLLTYKLTGRTLKSLPVDKAES